MIEHQLEMPIRQLSRSDMALNRVINASSIPDTSEKTVQMDLAGRIFEQIAFDAVNARQPEHRTLLSPDKTFKYFKKLYPDAEVRYDALGQKSLQGVTVPDGLLYDDRWQKESNNGLCRVYEYTLTKPSRLIDYLHKKQYNFNRLKWAQGKLLSNAELVFVIPDVYAFDLPQKFTSRLKIETVPVSPVEIRQVVTKYIDEIRSR